MQFAIDVPEDFSFLNTLRSHGWRHLAPYSSTDTNDELRRIHQFADGKVGEFSVKQDGRGLLVTADQECDRSELTEVVRHIFQLDLDMGPFHQYCDTQPKLAHIRSEKLGRMLVSPTLFEDVLKVICTVNTTWAQSCAMSARLCQHFGSSIDDGSDWHTFPKPEQIAAVSVDEFSTLARMGYRSSYVHAISRSIAANELDLEFLPELCETSDQLRRSLLALPGIGPYGAACLMLYLGRPEHVNVDSWARTLVARELGRPVSDKEVTAFFAEHGEWRGLVYVFYPWTDAI